MLTEELIRTVRRLEVRARRRVDSLLAGAYHSAFKGQGIEFAEVREYEPGDDVRSIDWNVTARTGKPFIKRFVEERELTVMLVVDRSASMSFGSGDRTKARVAAEVAAVIGLSAARNSDRVGLLAHPSDPELYLEPKKGRMHVLRIVRELLGGSPTSKSGGDTASPIQFLNRVLKRRAIVFLVSDFANLDGLDTPLRLLSRRHEVIGLRVTDPWERELPPLGLVGFDDDELGRRFEFDAGRRTRRRFAKAVREHDESLRRQLAVARVDLVDLCPSRDIGDDLAKYFQRRERAR